MDKAAETAHPPQRNLCFPDFISRGQNDITSSTFWVYFRSKLTIEKKVKFHATVSSLLMGKNTDDVFPASNTDSTGQQRNDFSAGVNAQRCTGIIPSCTSLFRKSI